VAVRFVLNKFTERRAEDQHFCKHYSAMFSIDGSVQRNVRFLLSFHSVTLLRGMP